MFSISAISKDEKIQEAARAYMTEKANGYLSYMNTKLAGKDYLTGKTFTVADAYAYIVTGWTKWLEIPLTPYKNIEAYMSRVTARPAVAKVLKDEGLV
jgi:glutathione S-transferase